MTGKIDQLMYYSHGMQIARAIEMRTNKQGVSQFKDAVLSV